MGSQAPPQAPKLPSSKLEAPPGLRTRNITSSGNPLGTPIQCASPVASAGEEQFPITIKLPTDPDLVVVSDPDLVSTRSNSKSTASKDASDVPDPNVVRNRSNSKSTVSTKAGSEPSTDPEAGGDTPLSSTASEREANTEAKAEAKSFLKKGLAKRVPTGFPTLPKVGDLSQAPPQGASGSVGKQGKVWKFASV